ncbi:hypothetical protein CsSME_00001446 [Camellia sinensis var. sinensis]
MAAKSDRKPASSGNSSTVNGGRTVKECQDMIRRSLRTPMVKFLREHLEKAGCSFGDGGSGRGGPKTGRYGRHVMCLVFSSSGGRPRRGCRPPVKRNY